MHIEGNQLRNMLPAESKEAMLTMQTPLYDSLPWACTGRLTSSSVHNITSLLQV